MPVTGLGPRGDRTSAAAATPAAPAAILAVLDAPAHPIGRLRELADRHPGIPIVAIARAPLESFIEGIDPARPVAIVAGSPRPDRLHLGIFLDKLIDADPFGLERCFAEGSLRWSIDLAGADPKAAALDAASKVLAGAGVPVRTVEDVLLVADELVANAILDAPAAARRAPGDSSAAGGDVRPAVLDLAWDGGRAGVAVTDSFGSLEPSAALESLRRAFRRGPDQIRRGPGGAGLGIYTAYLASSLLAFTVAPGRKTEALALVERPGRSGPVRSLGFFAAR
jgi:hypothetical protein